MLRYQYSSEDQVPAEHKAFYKKEVDGSMTLDVDQAPLRDRVDEFRNKNVGLLKEKDAMAAKMKEQETLLARYKGIDPERAAEAAETLRKLQEKQLIEAGELDRVVQLRTQSIVGDYQAQLDAQKKAISETAARERQYFQELSRERVDGAVASAVRSAGQLRAGAELDVLNRARNTFTIGEDGKLTIKKDAADAFNDKGEPITPAEWAQRLIKTAPHFFVEGQGGGAGGASSRSAPKGPGGNDPTPRVMDAAEFGRNAADILAGKVKVIPQGGLIG